MDSELSLKAGRETQSDQQVIQLSVSNSFVNNHTLVLKIGTVIKKYRESNN
jgi:hypothetical protein